MKCCICGKTYNPDDRIMNPLVVIAKGIKDKDAYTYIYNLSYKNTNNILALCPTCNKAATFAVIQYSDIYDLVEEKLEAPIYEKLQLKEL